MKNIRNIIALLVLSVAFYSCDADATLDEAEQAEQTQFDITLAADTGDEGDDGKREHDDD